jgi:NADH dehydrogenase FAD-containing subunit
MSKESNYKYYLRATKTDMCLSTRSLINKHNAHTDSVGVEKFKPDSNEIVLRNGRTIQYENLVIAMGQKENYQ